MTKNLAIVGVNGVMKLKGKIVDILAARFGVARYQGGHNAGHTITFGSCRRSIWCHREFFIRHAVRHRRRRRSRSSCID